jgi:acyl-CoA hydrolase
MNWTDAQRERLCTPEQAAALIASHSRVFLRGNCSVPRKVLAALVERAPDLTEVEIVQVLTLGDASYVAPELAGHLRVNTLLSAKIVPMLKPGAGVTTSRNHVHYVVTEQGVANLYGRTIAQRAQALIAIAAPEFRESLTEQAHELNYI